MYFTNHAPQNVLGPNYIFLKAKNTIRCLLKWEGGWDRLGQIYVNPL